MKLFSGDTAPKSGVYKVFGSDGRVINTLTVNEGDMMPPTQSPSHHFEIDK